MKNSAVKLNLLLCLVCFFISCTAPKPDLMDTVALIPLPQMISSNTGSLPLTSLQSYSVPNSKSVWTQELTKFWQETFQKNIENTTEGDLSFVLDETVKGHESYQIAVQKTGIEVRALSEEGLYRAWQTLQQFLVFSKANGALPLVAITDGPSFSYRGVMLDVARHFFSVAEVKRLIDLMALYKFNFLHLHLSDDQGWRIEIKSWPQLTEIGGVSEVGGTAGGYYTQEEYTDLVTYAANRFITVVPEIDMPGHTNAALNAYPSLNCDGKAPPIHTGIEVGFSSLCIDKPITYEFVDDVVRELAAITPGPYIHIGGDETHATPNDQFIKFIDSILPKVKRYGKTPMGWFETRVSHYSGTMVSQYWANEGNEPLKVSKGNPIVMSPSSFSYMDMKYDSLSKHGLFWAGYINAKKAYEWDPLQLVDVLPSEDIIGIEAPLWSETISDTIGMDYMLFPRLLGYAEIGWTNDSLRKWESYQKRVQPQLIWLKDKNVKPYTSPFFDSNQN